MSWKVIIYQQGRGLEYIGGRQILPHSHGGHKILLFSDGIPLINNDLLLNLYIFLPYAGPFRYKMNHTNTHFQTPVGVLTL